jgi:DNA-binding transcriptional LysR family regulator
LQEVADEPFVSFKQGHAIRQVTDDLCKGAGFSPAIRFESDDSSSMPGFVAAGFGVAIVPPEASKYADVVSLRITEPVARRAIGVAWAQGRYLSASASLFRDFAAAATPSSG